MIGMTVRDILAATGGRLLCGEENLPLLHISIDSRSMEGSDLFVPLVGEKVDAHRFIEKAFESGAAATLTSEHEEMRDTRPWIRVADTKKALQAVGAYYRNRLTLPLVGITGSVGKTTTREMVAAALASSLHVYKTPANHNSQVGVPITLSEITPEDEIGVLELGMSLPGEMTRIAQIARPDMAVITNIGIAHIEQLGSQENICREKLHIQDGMRDGGVLILNGDDPLLKSCRAKDGCRTVYYGTGENAAYRAEDIRLEDGYPAFTAVCGQRRIPVRLRVMGRHMVGNALAAIAVADLCGLPLLEAAKGLEEFTGFEGRQQIFCVNEITVIDDSYNASPVSMKAGLEVLASIPCQGRRIAVLADMKELGPSAPQFHREVGEKLAGEPIDILFTLGTLAAQIERGAREKGFRRPCFHFEDPDEMGDALLAFLAPGDALLLKGSNSMRLGKLAGRLREQR
ncbi:MAG: UDP-N-acetylmuramoyl-tripeptide--D-alanyl-D-alanine ligase [Clostridiales bacterium]|nr:UDP-N-acetylmuramoyl-tripeptide--D-alanyl-D-alanine ligase [Clostridiales bacterium]